MQLEDFSVAAAEELENFPKNEGQHNVTREKAPLRILMGCQGAMTTVSWRAD